MISGNLDTPEGGFDALLQVIVCQEVGHTLLAFYLFLYCFLIDSRMETKCSTYYCVSY